MTKPWGLACLIISMLVGGTLVVPLPAEAGVPTLRLDGATINVSTSKTSCPNRSGYNACFDLLLPLPPTAPLEVNNKWIVFDCSASNNPCGATFHGRAKVDVNDVASCATCTSDMLAIGGIGIKAKFPSSTGVSGTLVLEHTFNDASNSTGTFYWAMTEQGWFDPPTNPFPETVGGLAPNTVGNSVTFNAEARKPTDNSFLFSLGGFTKASITSPTGPDSVVSFGITQTTPQAKGTCDTGSQKCNPKVRYTFTFTVKGNDLFVLQNSLGGGGQTCDTNKGPTCAEMIAAIAQKIKEIEDEDKQENLNAGAVEGQLCQGTCILLRVKGTPAASAEDKVFTLTATGEGLPTEPFTITLDQQQSGVQGQGDKTFSNLQPDPPAGDRTFRITGYAPGGAQGDFQLDQITSESNGCTFMTLNEGLGNNKTKVGLTVTSLQEGANQEEGVTCVLLLHVH